MKTVGRVLCALVALSLVAAACGDDGSVDQDTVDSVLDDGGDDAADDSGDDMADDSADDADGDDMADDGGDDGSVPVAATPSDHCVVLHHYQEPTLFPEAPYYVSVFTDIEITADDVVEVTMPNGEDFELLTRVSDGEAIGGIDVFFPVFGPGQVELPQITINGEPLDLSTMYWEGNTGFVAAGAEVRDEEIYGAALPCTLAYMVMVEPPSLSTG